MFSALSLRQRLPVYIAALLFGVILVSTWASYRGMRNSALTVGRERLLNLTNQLTNLLRQTATTLTNRTLATANESAIRKYLEAPSDEAKSAAVAALQPFTPAQDPTSIRVELWTAARSAALIVPEGATSEFSSESEFNQVTKEPYKAAGDIRMVDGTIAYPIVAAARDTNGRILGYLVRWRKLFANPEARKQVTELVGHQATLYFGNADGSVWTDMVTTVAAPPMALKNTTSLTTYARDGNQVMALGQPLSGTPWFVMVELPEDALLAKPNQFLKQMTIIGSILLVVGVGITFFISRSVTRPLNSLTAAAVAISEGDYSRTVDTSRKDELGHLARAFSAMTARVSQSHHELEKKIRHRTSELEAANKELESFSYSVSHDLRAPLRAMNGFSRILLEDHGSELSSEARTHIERIQSSARQMGILVDDLLDFSRLSRQKLQKQRVAPADLVNQVLKEFASEQSGRNVEVSVGELAPVQADAGLLKQVYVNLLSNAFKYTRGRDEARIEIGSTNSNGNSTIYYVRDNGAGFDMQYAGKLFGVFQRLHRPEEFEGTGVGLAIVQRIIHRHGGVVWAESEVNKGTTFSFELPEDTND